MRVKSYLLAVALCGTLPFMVQGADFDSDPPEPIPRAKLRSISPIIVETESGMLTVHFRSKLGEVYVCLQEITGTTEYSQSVDTSVQNHTILAVPAGTYILTIFDTAGNLILQESVVIP